jgi:hypothetical protein
VRESCIERERELLPDLSHVGSERERKFGGDKAVMVGFWLEIGRETGGWVGGCGGSIPSGKRGDEEVVTKCVWRRRWWWEEEEGGNGGGSWSRDGELASFRQGEGEAARII